MPRWDILNKGDDRSDRDLTILIMLKKRNVDVNPVLVTGDFIELAALFNFEMVQGELH